MDIVITGQQAWDVEIGSNCKNIALEFTKNHRVLYVNAPLDRRTLLKHSHEDKVSKRWEVIRKSRPSIEEVAENLWVLYPDRLIESINWLPASFIFDIFNWRNNRLFAKSILRATRQLGFHNFLHFNDNDIFRSFYLKELLKPRASVYYSRDYMVAVEYWKKHGVGLEPRLIAKSDLCVANSTYLADYCRQYNPKSYYVGQGCDLDMFAAGINMPEPADMVQVPHPRLGYVGSLQSLRLDMELLQFLAVTRPEWTIVLVGPEDDAFRQSALHGLPNVIFTGSREVGELPAYINAFDVCINPQILNEVTIGNYPRKIDEYLAVGKPSVVTKTDAMSVFAAHVYLAGSQEEYIRLIELALEENSGEKVEARRAFASLHTWENSVAEIYKAIAAAGFEL